MSHRQLLKSCFLILSLIFSSISLAQDLASHDKSKKLTPISVQVNWNHQFEFAGFYAAIKEGYYRDLGLDVTVQDWKPGIYGVDEVVAGRAQFATGYTSTIVDYVQGKPISLVMASFQFSPMVLLSHEPVLSLQQLAGKKVMHYGNMQINSLIAKANAVVDEPAVSLDSTGSLQDFIDKKVDFYAAYNTNEPYRLRKEGIPFYILDPKTYGIQSYGDLIITSQKLVREQPDVVAAFRDATIKGWEYAINHQEETVDYILNNYEVVKNRDALLQEAAAIKVYVQPGNSKIGSINPVKLMASAVDAKETGLISQLELEQINMEEFLFRPYEERFTIEELAYIQSHPVIKIGNDSYWEPFEYVDKDGVYKGMAADYFELISKQLGVKFEYFKNKPWWDVVDAAKSGEIPIYSCAVATPERREYMSFTEPYLSFPLVIASTSNLNFIDDYSQLNGKTVAVPEGYWSQEWLEKNYPQIDLLLVDSVKDGLEAVLHDKAFAYSGNLASINFAIKRYGLDGLHIAGDSGARFELAIGVSKQEPLLLGIMEKALQNITPQQRSEIYNKWIQLEMVKRTDNSTLLSVILLSLVIALILVLTSLVFYRQKKQQEFYIRQVNELSLATYTNFKNRQVEWVSDSFLRMIGCRQEEVLYHSHDIFRHPKVAAEYYDEIYKTVGAGKVWSGELRARSCHGHEFWVLATITPEIKRGKVVGAWTTRVDISDKKRLEELAIKDSLTGVYNRNQFNELFESQVHRAGRSKSSFCMAMFDVDDFKLINDRYGHQRGDEVLVEVVNITKRYFGRANDLIFRVGGEEFVILTDYASAEEFESYLNEFREGVRDLHVPNPDSESEVLTVSVGGLYCSRMNPYIQSSQVYSRVDKVLYEAKMTGRNRVCMDKMKELCDS